MISVDEPQEVCFAPTGDSTLSCIDLTKRLVVCFMFMLLTAAGGVALGNFVGQLPSEIIAKYLNIGFDEAKIQACKEAIEAIPEHERATTELSKGLPRNPVDECRLFRPDANTKPATVGDLRRPEEFGAIIQEYKHLRANVETFMAKIGMVVGGVAGFYGGLIPGASIVVWLFPERSPEEE